MQIRQYVYFAVRTDGLAPDEITARVGIQPDKIAVRGSRGAHPLRPRTNHWQIVCDEKGLTVDEQIGRVVRRLISRAEAIGALVDELDDPTGDRVVTVLQVVRDFDSDDGEEDQPTPPGFGFTKLGGQHHLLGWHLDAEVLDFLQRTRATLSVDEYG